MNEDIERLQAYLDSSPYDWEARLVLADAYEDQEQTHLSVYQRWAAKHNVTPIWWVDEWFWWSNLSVEPGKPYAAIGYFWNLLEKDNGYGLHQTNGWSSRERAEDVLRQALEQFGYEHPWFRKDGQLDAFTRQYVETALWGEMDQSDENTGGQPLDANYGPGDIDVRSLALIVAECHKFQKENTEDIATNPEQAGHDFWLTRNRHGAGFWDGNWDEDVGKRLTEASHRYGECSLYAGDDGKLYYHEG